MTLTFEAGQVLVIRVEHLFRQYQQRDALDDRRERAGVQRDSGHIWLDAGRAGRELSENK